MKYIQYTCTEHPDQIRVGYMNGDSIVDICCQDCSMPKTMLDILKTGSVDKVKSLQSSNPKSILASSVRLAAPIYGMDKILCIATNYGDHCRDRKITPPAIPLVFSKFSSTIIGPNDNLRIRTDVCKKVDWEVELAVVIGKTASSVKAADAYNYVFGYTIAQDITDREWQKEKNGTHFTLGKCSDTFCPIGPYIVTSDEIGDPHNLAISCSLNGVQKQNSNTSNLIHTVPAIIERISTVMTLYPGDLILTGTPDGIGSLQDPPEFLKPGDVLHSEIQKIGSFDTRVVKF